MGIEYRYNVGYGFLLPEKQFALPAEWPDVEQWYGGVVDEAISGSGLVSVYGGSQCTGEHFWGFVADVSLASLDKDGEALKEIREVEPHIHSNLQDIRARVKRPSARIGWVMWRDTF